MRSEPDNLAGVSELWRAIPSLPGYLASSAGLIMRLPTYGAMPNGGVRNYGGQAWQGVWSPTDNRFIVVVQGHTYKVARLVCEAFHGPAPADKPICMHLDEDSRNNRPENLAWGTQKENLNAPGFLAHCRGRTGEKNPLVKARRREAQA